MFRKYIVGATTVAIFLENFTPMVLGIISQKISITIDAIKIVTTDINSSGILFTNILFNLEDSKLVMVTFRISSANKIVAIIDAGLLRNPSNIFPVEDFFLIRYQLIFNFYNM